METETYKKAKEILEKFDPARFKELEVSKSLFASVCPIAITDIVFSTMILSKYIFEMKNYHFIIYSWDGSVGWGCRVHRLHLSREVRLLQRVSWI